VKTDKATKIYLENLVGEPGLAMIERLSTDELTDQDIATQTGSDLNTVRRTLFTLYEHRLASYVEERDKGTGWIVYRWHVDFSDIQRHVDEDARRLIARLQDRLEDELNNVYYTCENNCGRHVFAIASEYLFVCPLCNAALNYQDNAALIDALEQKIDELKADAQAIFDPENLQVLQLARAE
jgi:transcription initiation factor TFIIE subunit alpha